MVPYCNHSLPMMLVLGFLDSEWLWCILNSSLLLMLMLGSPGGECLWCFAIILAC